MKLYARLLFFTLMISIASCSNENNTLSQNIDYNAVQQKALAILNGVWISNEIKVEYEISGIAISMSVVPSDTLVFLSQYPAPKSFYTYDYLQGKEVENFVACGICELKSSSGTNTYFSPSCYFYISPKGDELCLYNIETEQFVKSYSFRVASATCFYAGAYNGIPIIFNKR